MVQDNYKVVDLNKVLYASYAYKNQYGDVRRIKPKFSVHGSVMDPDLKMSNGETAFEQATRRELIDIWTPVCVLQLQSKHSLTYTGKKAKSIWHEWNRRIYGNK